MWLQNCNENGHKEGFCRESSTGSSTSQNPNNKKALIQTRSSLIPERSMNSRCRATKRTKRSGYYPHVLLGLRGISLVSLLIWRQKRTGDQIY
ncbi:unnamed protein product [Hymenolepis diminuta]|uniref:Uncharacterized protein n=1 Tax=Hymenolepis diminuta TaxID=6216 RepID=A0A564Y5C3_HYMDI|nr:unnamed protein product [Hymenolepis diminuta]